MAAPEDKGSDMTPLDRIIASVTELVASIARDENGELIGGHWIGGNGGLLSRESHAKADEVRRALESLRAQSAPEPQHASFWVLMDGTLAFSVTDSDGATWPVVRVAAHDAHSLAGAIFRFHTQNQDPIGPTVGNG